MEEKIDGVNQPDNPSDDHAKVDESAPSTSAPPDDTPRSDKTTAKPPSEEELMKAIRNPDVARALGEMLRGNRIASAYIDTRSGGMFFGSDARISGDLISGEHIHVTHIHGSVTDSSYMGGGGRHGHVQPQVPSVGIAYAGSTLLQSIRKAKQVYVRPKGYAKASKILEERHLLILWGRAHWGKWTSALHMLTAFHGEAIFEIDPTVSLDELCSRSLEPESGYVLDTVAPNFTEKLTLYRLKQLSASLQQQKARLVITADSSAPLSHPSAEGYIVSWTDVPDRMELLRKHLAFYIENREHLETAYILCEEEVVQQMLGPHLSPRDMDRLAELVAEAAVSGLALEQALGRFGERALKQAEEWFETHTSLEDRTLMIALAALNGGAYQAVLTAGDRLRERISPSSDDDEVDVTENLFFGRTRSQRVNAMLAHLIDDHEATEFGQSSIKRVVLDNPALQRAVLQYVWEEYDRLNHILLRWLFDLGVDASFDVRARAAAAVGELSKYDFRFVREAVLLPWANHRDRRARQSAAMALGVPAWEGAFAPQVLGLLHHWSTLENNPRLSWTAAVAYGGLVGFRFPETALHDLGRLARIPDIDLFEAATRSILTIFREGIGQNDYFLHTLDMLSAWVEEAQSRFELVTGLFSFLVLAANADVEVGDEGKTWPTLLWLIQNEIGRTKIVELWRRALNTKTTRKIALDILHDWALRLDNDAYLSDSFEQLILALGTGGSRREYDRLCAYLARWHSHPQQASSTVGRILTRLQESEND